MPTSTSAPSPGTLLEPTLTHLQHLVAFDTRNPPRAIGSDGIFDYLRDQLTAQGFSLRVDDHGAGAVSMLAVRGTPRRLFNVHLDTVPDSPAWTDDPLRLRVQVGRAIGLGACDIKGAAAGLLTAAARTRGDAAFLFSSDEEANDARCIAAFLRGGHDFEEVLVAEPTRCEAVLAHRGIASVLLRFTGRAGHASAADARHASAVHQAVDWGAQALAQVESLQHQRFGGLTGLRFNIGRIDGGIKGNVIAPTCELRFGFRPLPSMDTDALHAGFKALADETGSADYQQTFRGPPLPAGDIAAAERRRLAARDLADALDLPIGNAVDFWTEASLFSAAGLTALVYGPGDIAQAHTADEWVGLDQLQHYTERVTAILS